MRQFSFNCKPVTFPTNHFNDDDIIRGTTAGNTRGRNVNRFHPYRAGLAIALVLAGCTVGPNYQRPGVLKSQPLPASFTTNGVIWKTAEPAANAPRGAWWAIFRDAGLDRLEDRGAADNQNLAGTLAALERARALVNVARAGFFPQLTVDPSYVHQRTSANGEIDGRPAGRAFDFSTYTLPTELNWEIDLFGRIRRQTEGARNRLAAAADDLESLRLLVHADIAQDYFTVRALDSEIALVVSTIETYRRSLELTRTRRQGGIADDLDVSEAETQLRITEAQLPPLRQQRAQLLDALAALCGQPAMGFSIAATNTTPPEVHVPALLPGELLERRPDVAAAERRVAAANADIGVAKSAFYPKLTLNGMAGVQSVSAGTLLAWPSRLWSLGPTLDFPIFTGGLNRAQLAAARAAYDQTVATYRQTALAAFQDVQDQLAAEQFLGSQFEGENLALASTRRTLDIANDRYQAGLITYLQVAIAQSNALDTERIVTRLAGSRLVAVVGLIKALGGGWQPPAK